MTPARFRQLVSALNGTSEGAHMGHADFRTAGRVFASLDKVERWASMQLSSSEQQRWVSTAPEVFVPAAGAWGVSGWTKVDLAHANEESVGEALTCAWQQATALAVTKPRAAKAAASREPRTTVAARTRPASAPARAKTAATRAKSAAGRPASRTKASSKTIANSGVAEVDAYLAAAPSSVRPILEKIRGIVRRVAPKAEEVISYRMPAFRLDGMLIFYAPFKAHIGLFPPVKGDAALEADLAPYRGPKGNLRFPLDEPMPYPLIRRVVQARLAEQRSRLTPARTRSTRA